MRGGNSFLVILKNYKVQYSRIHFLRSSVNVKCKCLNAVIVPKACHIISRFESSEAIFNNDKLLHLPKKVKIKDHLPDVPVVEQLTNPVSDLPDIITEVVIPLNKLGEPTLQSLGLGSAYTPVGWVQRILEFIHVNFNLPWWASISICVVIVRLLMFPLVVKNQRNSIQMHNIMPQMQEIQMKMQNAKTYGNHMEAMKFGHELAIFMKENSVNPAKNVLLPLFQAPVFISFFMALRKMASVPVESMTRGGMLWFQDLTVMDEFYLLPLITCTTLWITLEVGADFNKLPSSSVTSRYMIYVIKVIPILVFPFIMHFPSGICVYWASTNMMSLIQVAFLKIPAVRKYYKIDIKKSHDKQLLGQKKGFVKDMKSVYSNFKFAKEISERERLDEYSFRRAGRIPPTKTYKYNPTLKQSAIEAKKG
ncbi:hypothetical protein PGB90_007447 [Kerria lacca]